MVFENDDVSMDQVFLVVDVNHICRFCLRSDGALTAIFDDEIDSQILAQLSSFAKIDVNIKFQYILLLIFLNDQIYILGQAKRKSSN